MIVTLAERLSGSPYVDAISQGCTIEEGSTIRPAECKWHMVLVRHPGGTQLLVVGPLTTSGVVSWGEGGEILWIRFKLGVFMPHLPHRKFIDTEQALPGATSQRFWLKGSSWQFPAYENVETFVEKLVKAEILAYDPVVNAVLQDQPHDLAARTVRHRFLQATGLPQNQVRQIERAQQAAVMLKQGISILDTMYALDYYDQPHMTRSLKQWVGYTPAQLYCSSKDCHRLQDSLLWPEYNEDGDRFASPHINGRV
jgi:AraC-like DNA-binding protein